MYLLITTDKYGNAHLKATAKCAWKLSELKKDTGGKVVKLRKIQSTVTMKKAA